MLFQLSDTHNAFSSKTPSVKYLCPFLHINNVEYKTALSRYIRKILCLRSSSAFNFANSNVPILHLDMFYVWQRTEDAKDMPCPYERAVPNRSGRWGAPRRRPHCMCFLRLSCKTNRTKSNAYNGASRIGTSGLSQVIGEEHRPTLVAFTLSNHQS